MELFSIPSRPASNLLHDHFGSGIFRRQVAAHVVTFFLIGQSRSTPCRLRLAPPSLKWLLNHSCAAATHPLQWPSLCGFWQAAPLNGCCCPAPSRQGRSRLRCSCNLQETERKSPPGVRQRGTHRGSRREWGDEERRKKRVIVDLQAPPPPRHRNRSSSPAAVNFEIGRHRRPLFNELRYSCLSLPSIHTYTCSSYSAICIWLLQLQPGNKPRFVGWRRLRPSIILATLGLKHAVSFV